MKSTIKNLISEVKSRMSGYAAYLNYQLMLFSVKAEAPALLPITIQVDDQVYNLEDVADVAQVNEYQFAIIPKDKNDCAAICKGILESQPEYKLEQEDDDSEEEEEILEEDETLKAMKQDPAYAPYFEQMEQEKKEKAIIIYCTMPKVNKTRRDIGMEYVDVICKEINAKMDISQGIYAARITAKLKGANEEEITEAKEELKKVYEQHKDMCKEFKEKKEKEIEEGYQHYLSEAAAEEKDLEEEKAARGEAVTKTMKFDPFAEDNEEEE